KYLNRVHRSAPYLDRNADAALAVRIKLEQTDCAVFLSECRASDIENVVEPFQINRPVHTQIRTSSFGEFPCEFYVDGHASVLSRGIDPHHFPGNRAVMCIHQRRLANLNVASLRLGNF